MEEFEKLFKFKPTGYKASRGRVLISEPLLEGFFFSRSVLLLASHNDEGAFGLVLNKKTDYKLNEITDTFGDLEADVYIGGPIETEKLFVLHKRGDLIKNSEEIIDGVFWGGNMEQISTYIKSGIIKQDEVRFYLGYSGWSPNQLDEELERYSWVVSKTTEEEIFTKQPNKLWRVSIDKFGDKFESWLIMPSNPRLN